MNQTVVMDLGIVLAKAKNLVHPFLTTYLNTRLLIENF